MPIDKRLRLPLPVQQTVFNEMNTETKPKPRPMHGKKTSNPVPDTGAPPPKNQK